MRATLPVGRRRPDPVEAVSVGELVRRRTGGSADPWQLALVQRNVVWDVTRLTVDFDWQRVGGVAMDAAGSLVFPVLSREPGLYRFWIESSGNRPGVYIGEASELRRRMQHYRTPGPSQVTNIRLNELLKAAILGGSVVTLSTITRVTVALDGEEPRDLPLGRRNARLISEQAAIAAAAVENLSDRPDGPPVYPRLLDRPGVGEDEYE